MPVGETLSLRMMGVFADSPYEAVELTGSTRWTVIGGLENGGGGAFQAKEPGSWTVVGRFRANGELRQSSITIRVR